MPWTVWLFRFFASLKLAIILIVSLAVVFAVGTFAESYYGTRAAQIIIYYTPWFAFMLVLLGLNLAASAVDRWPWKKKHLGFLLTHLGIILILIGSLISLVFGIEGQLALEEGRSGSRMTLDDPLIQIVSVDTEKRFIFPLKKRAFYWKGEQALTSKKQTSLKLSLLEDMPKALVKGEVVKSDTGLPALHISLQGSMASIDQWLFLDDPERSEVALGPATIRFDRVPLQPSPVVKKEVNEWGTLQFDFQPGGAAGISLDKKSVGKTYDVPETEYKIKIDRILKHGLVLDKELVETSDEWKNPAVVLALTGKGINENHTIFSKFPEFPTIHGLGESAAGFSIRYVRGSADSMPTGKNALHFIYREGLQPLYQVKHGDKIVEGEVELGAEIETGWMDFKFIAEEYFERGEMTSITEVLPTSSTRTDAFPVIKVLFEKAGEQKVLQLMQGEINYLNVGESDYHVMYGLSTFPMGFQVELKDFMIDTNPGTNQPASFKSEVILKDVAKSIQKDVLIQMNEPLKHNGFKVFQAAYQREEGQPDISIFSVARDPGNGIKYLGTIVMTLGLFMLFYIKPLSTLKTSDPKSRKR